MPINNTQDLLLAIHGTQIDYVENGQYEDLETYESVITPKDSVLSNWTFYTKYPMTGTTHSQVSVTNITQGTFYPSLRYDLSESKANFERGTVQNIAVSRESEINWVTNHTAKVDTNFKAKYAGAGYNVTFENGSHESGYVNPADYVHFWYTIQDGYEIKSGTTLTMTWRVNGMQHKAVNTFKKDYPAGSEFESIFSLGKYANNFTSLKFTLNATPTTPPVVHHNVSFHLEHATVTPNDSQLEQGEHTWNFTADDGYIFTKAGGVKNPNTGMYGTQIPATNTNTTSLTYNLTRDIEVRLQATPVPVSDLPVNLKGSHISEYPATVKRDATTITLKAESGYLFKSDTTTNYMAGDNVLTSIITPASETDTLTINLTPISNNVTSVEINSLPVKPDAPTGGYLHTYRVSTQQLNQLSNDLIWNYTGSESAYDVTRYINSIIEYPFVPADDFVSANISLGNKKSSVIASEYRSQYYLFNVGSIQVLPTYHNSYDYNVNDATLYLPYMPAVKLPIGKIMNRVIKIQYRINVSTGDTTVLIYADESLIHNFNGTLGHKVPFVNDMKNVIKTDNTFMFDNGIKQAYIEINQNTPSPEVEWYSDNKVIKGSELTSGRYQAKLNSTPVSVPIEDYNILEKYLKKGFIL